MSFGSVPFGEGIFGGAIYAPASSPPIGGAPEVQIVIDPFTIEVAGVSMKGHQLINSLTMDFEIGRPGSARFSLYNIGVSLEIGAPVRILYYNDILFVGAVDRISLTSNNLQTFVRYDVECTDNSYLLFRKKIKFTLTNMYVSNIANTVISSAPLVTDGVTVGTVDNNVQIPSASSDGVTAFEFLNGVAASTGTIFYIDNDKKLNFIGTSTTAAPGTLDENSVNDASVEIDRETYRNQQTTTVTGTPLVEGEQPVVVTLVRNNDAQRAERASVEGGSGTYSDMASITHPTSNVNLDLVKLANAYNKISLALTGSIRESLRVTTRQVGFAVGQFATVDLPQIGASGSWLIRRASLREESGRFLVSSLELNQATLMRRSQELWVEVVRKGTVSITPPSASYTNSSVNSTPGAGSWQVPDGVTDIQITLYGSGGGGGGGASSNLSIAFQPPMRRVANGAKGGGGALVVKIMQVTPGTVFSFWVGAGGTAGLEHYRANSYSDAIGGTGGDGAATYVQRSGGTIAQALGGRGGLGGLANAYGNLSISYPPGASQGGSGGDSVSVGGAAGGGVGGIGALVIGSGSGNGLAGANGSIVFEW